VSDKATVTPSNGSTRDLTSPVTYTVMGPDGATRRWTVRAVEMRSPVLPGLYADPNIAQFGDTFYIYATSDGYAGWGGKDFYVWKSTNLVDWERSERPFLTLDGENGNVPWASGNAWAPTIIKRGRK
jgi:beta-xylosidase